MSYSYTSQNWASNQIISSAKLSAMDAQISSNTTNKVEYSTASGDSSNVKIAWIPYHIGTADITSSTNGVSTSSTGYNYETGFVIVDKNQKPFSWFAGYLQSDGTKRTDLVVQNGSNEKNYFRVMIKNDGTKGYSVADPGAFRDAIHGGTSIAIVNNASWSDVKTNLEQLNTNETGVIFISSTVMKFISNNVITDKFQGFVARVGTNIYDFFGGGGTNVNLFTFRLSNLTTSSATFEYYRTMSFPNS